MDKKELQNLIDRIGLTGPEGIKKIKKVLKELSDGSSSGSVGEDEEYTIAQALNDLNERVEELQGQLELATKQKTLKIIVTDESLTVQQALSCLEIDGKTPTIDEMRKITPGFVIDAKSLDWGELLVTFVHIGNSSIDITFGGYNTDYGEYGWIHLDFLNDNSSHVSIYEI